MAHSVSPGSFRSDDSGTRRQQSLFTTDLIRRYGLKAILALVVAALFAFAPLTLLYWFNEIRCQPIAMAEPGQHVVVKPGRYQQDQNQDQPGDTALLKVMCEVPGFDSYRELLCDEDPVRRGVQASDSTYVRRELVYVRRAGLTALPFALLGKPPVSVWLPAGDYQVLVVHESPRSEPSIDARSYAFPWVSVMTDCSLEARQTTACRVPLPHDAWGDAASIKWIGDTGSATNSSITSDELAPILKACENFTAVPTPAGYLMAIGEPIIQHSIEHRDCTADMRELSAVPREWTRDQLAALRNWLPADAQPARAKLSQLVNRLVWREFLEGWFCYAAAAISGLVFTRWGTIALLEPWRRRDTWNESLALLTKIALASGAAWLLLQVLTDSSGCHGPVPFRLH